VAEAARRQDAADLLAVRLDAPIRLEPDGVTVSARVGNTARVAPALAELGDVGIDVGEFSLGQPTLDEVFMALTGHGAADDADPTTGNGVAA
jgi:ABC-2 type transport system ATP-binding protein